MGSVRTDCSGRCLRRRTYSSVVCSRRIYCLPYGFVALAALDQRTPGVAAWLHASCFTAGSPDRAHHDAAIRTANPHRTLGSADLDGRRAFSTEILFYQSCSYKFS